MKKLTLVFSALFCLCACNSYTPSPYKAAKDRYEGTYRVISISADDNVAYDLFNCGLSELSLGEQFAENGYFLGNAGITIDETSGSGTATFMFITQRIRAKGEPPYSMDSPIEEVDAAESYSQRIPLTVQADMSIRWSKGIIDYKGDESLLHRTLLGEAEVLFLDGAAMRIHFEQFPIFDYQQAKLLLIPVTYYLERE